MKLFFITDKLHWNCFCQNFGIDAADPAGDVTAWMVGEEIFFRANTKKGEKLVASLEETDGAAVEAAKATKGQPTMIVCKTTKGKGVSFMENNAGWHGKAPNAEEYEQAVKELKAQL